MYIVIKDIITLIQGFKRNRNTAAFNIARWNN